MEERMMPSLQGAEVLVVFRESNAIFTSAQQAVRGTLLPGKFGNWIVLRPTVKYSYMDGSKQVEFDPESGECGDLLIPASSVYVAPIIEWGSVPVPKEGPQPGDSPRQTSPPQKQEEPEVVTVGSPEKPATAEEVAKAVETAKHVRPERQPGASITEAKPEAPIPGPTPTPAGAQPNRSVPGPAANLRPESPLLQSRPGNAGSHQ